MLDPLEEIEREAQKLRRLSDDEFLATLERFPVLPPERGEHWKSDEDWLLGYRYVALGDVACERRLRAAVVPLLRRACLGDPGEMMRGLRHSLECIAKPDWSFLATAYVSAASLEEPGARFWSIAGLGIVRDPATMPTLLAALRDPVGDVRFQTCQSLSMICQTNSSLRARTVTALRAFFADAEIGEAAREAADEIAQMR
jgi:hypothetical protein